MMHGQKNIKLCVHIVSTYEVLPLARNLFLLSYTSYCLEGKGGLGIRRKQLPDDLKGAIRYWELKEALTGTF